MEAAADKWPPSEEADHRWGDSNLWFHVQTPWLYIPTKHLCTKLCDMHLFTWEKFAHRIFSDPSNPVDTDLPKCRSHTKATSAIGSIACRIKTYRNLNFLNLARILTNREQTVIYFSQNLLEWSSNDYFSLGFFPTLLSETVSTVFFLA